MNKDLIEKERYRMIHMTKISTHSKILTTRIFSLSFLNLLTLMYRNALGDNSSSVFYAITFYLQRVEKLSQKNIALKIIEIDLRMYRRNEELGEHAFESKIKEIMKYLRDSLK